MRRCVTSCQLEPRWDAAGRVAVEYAGVDAPLLANSNSIVNVVGSFATGVGVHKEVQFPSVLHGPGYRACKVVGRDKVGKLSGHKRPLWAKLMLGKVEAELQT